jgi:hypothetical protein
MHGAIPPLPSMPSWHAQLEHGDNFTFTFTFNGITCNKQGKTSLSLHTKTNSVRRWHTSLYLNGKGLCSNLNKWPSLYSHEHTYELLPI